MKKLFTFLPTLFLFTAVFANSGYKIEIELTNYSNDTLLLGYYYGEQQYIKDTALINDQNKFVFEGEEVLAAGVYLVVLLPQKNYLNILVNDEGQYFSLSSDTKQLVNTTSFKNSKDNELFYEYLNFLNEQRTRKEALLKEQSTATTKEQIAQIDEAVNTYQKNIVAEYPSTLTSAFIKNYIATSPPTFEGTAEEVQLKRLQYARDHYFDNINLGDARLLRTPFLHQRIDFYTNQLTYQHPDSITKTLDFILEQTAPAEETFKYYLHHFYNTYANAKVVGMDAVCVHLTDNYFSAEKTPWMEEEELVRLQKRAATLKPILIGKTAPNIKLYEIDIDKTIQAKTEEDPYKRWGAKRALWLHDIPSPYTVVYMWKPSCSVCKKATPKMLDFYEQYKDKGVEVLGICTENVQGDIVACAEYAKDKEMKWLNVFDPFYQSKFMSVYDVTGTPKIFILNKDKKILMKGIGADQLEEVMENILKWENK